MRKIRPKTVKEAVNTLMGILSKRDKSHLLRHPDPTDHHMTLGLWIRNEFGLWDGNQDLLMNCQGTRNKEYLIIDPDTASDAIIRKLLSRLRREKPT